MTYSYEIAEKNLKSSPPFSDRCPTCADWRGAVVPYATTTEGETLTAFYRHRRCGHQWSCRWLAQWDDTWAA